MEKRIFVAHAKSDPDESIERWATEIRAALQAAAGGATVKVVLGRDDYRANSMRCGSWETWQREVASGIDYITREPRYHAIVVTDAKVGAATQAIVRMALAAGKIVFLWGHGQITRVTRVVEVNRRDFKQGWEVR